jgi:parallel beta-helix repeat protein
MWFDTNSCVYTEIDGTWVASNVVGIDIKPSQPAGASWKISGARIYNNSSDGLVVNDGYVTVDGASINTNGGIGINVGTAITDGFIVSACQIRGNTGYGISIVVASDNFLIEGNYFSSNTAGALLNNASVSNSKVIRDNVGLITEANGTATVTGGNTTVVVSHGLHDTPTHVLVERTNASDGLPHFVTTLTSTQFTINNGAAAGIDRTFAWRAMRGFR